MSKLVLVAATAAAYVLGAKAGRERYAQITDLAQRWWNDPRVQKKRSEASETIKDRAPEAKEKFSGAAKHASGKTRSISGDGTSTGDVATGATPDGEPTIPAAAGTSASRATSSGGSPT